MFIRRHFNKEKAIEAFRVTAPPNKNAVEQLLTLQEAITQVETIIQAANIILLKMRALLFSVLPQVHIPTIHKSICIPQTFLQGIHFRIG